jgi:hypothetical protein
MTSNDGHVRDEDTKRSRISIDAWVVGSGVESSATTTESAFGGVQARSGFFPFPRLVWALEFCLLFGMLGMRFLFLPNFFYRRTGGHGFSNVGRASCIVNASERGRCSGA